MNEKLTLTELQLIIKDSLYLALPDFYWLVAEISEIKENYAGHCYLELVEKHTDDRNVRARARAIIWNTRYRLLKPLFENVTGESLKTGMKILIRVKIDYNEIYGLSLIVSDIDPSYTVGEMAIKRQLILKRLEEEGVITMNKEHEFPFVPQRIAVISSATAAGWSDFSRHLRENHHGYVFYTALFEAVMQGAESERSILGAFDRIAENISHFDLVAIIRGGGSQSDLSWFDNYNIAYYVTQFPIPVLTGIGHEKDVSVTDIVAFKALRTPTAVADFLINSIAEAEIRLTELGNRIADKSRSIISGYRDITAVFLSKLKPVAKLAIADQKEMLSNRIMGILNIGKEYLTKAGFIPENLKSRLKISAASCVLSKKTYLEKSNLDLMNYSVKTIESQKTKLTALENSLGILNPVNVLKRGYTLTSINGVIIRSVQDTKKDDIIETRLFDGKIKSRITGKQHLKN
ncbi:MAG: exodeoxyribonuclease VII large subunit [Bacteroidales bacterium]|nr:exodeoxyribonuclease VII large subunit [Bacteroidales bacterium]